MARNLTPDEVDALLASDWDLAQRVWAHRQGVTLWGWDQVANANLGPDVLNIPARGYTVDYAPLGTVVIFPDAAGTLHFLLPQSSAEQSVAVEVAKPSYVSPDAGILPLMQDMVNRAGELVQGAAGFAALAAGVMLAFQFWGAIKK